MNREIKFKYWNTLTSKMVNDPDMPYKSDWTITELFSDRGWVWLQYTGLKDKNGVEIFEGDILKRKRNCIFDQGYKNDVVEFRKGAFCTTSPLSVIVSGFDAEVVGNIYENPELLG